MHGYRPVSSSEDSCCLDGQKLCVVACCMMSFLSIGTAAMLHLAPHHVAAGASYVGLDQNAVHGMHQHVKHWAQNSGLDVHLQRAGQWVAGVGHDMHRVGADFADHAGLDQHMQRAGDWAREVHQQLLGQDQILSPYECSTTADIPKWSRAHKEWCCEHQDTACAEASTTASTSPSPQHYMWISVPLHKGKYDCAAGIDNWLKGWSHRKQNWCCQNKGIGCLHEVSRPFDCLKGTASRWPAQKSVWCCLHENRGCPMQGASEVHKFDCDDGFSNWAVGWSTAKQEWCCVHHGRGLKWIKAASIAPLTCTTGTNAGRMRRRLGAAKPTVWDVLPTNRCTTVMQGMRTGERAGLEARRPGAVPTPLEAASTTARPRNKPGHRQGVHGVAGTNTKVAAQTMDTSLPQRLLQRRRTLVMYTTPSAPSSTAAQATPTGRRDGQLKKRLGAANTKQKAAPTGGDYAPSMLQFCAARLWR